MQTHELTERDKGFFSEVAALLSIKYPDLKEKFGIWRAHQHFELAEDEVFHETSDETSKTSNLRIIKKSALPEGAFVSTWQLSGNNFSPSTWCCDRVGAPKV